MQEKIVNPYSFKKMYLKEAHVYVYCFLYAADIGVKLWQF